MSEQSQVIIQTALQTALTVAASDPKLAAALVLAPLFNQLITTVVNMQQAGKLTPEALENLFSAVGQNIQSTHDKWVALG